MYIKLISPQNFQLQKSNKICNLIADYGVAVIAWETCGEFLAPHCEIYIVPNFIKTLEL